MAEFAYHNTKNASTMYTFFELNYDYHPYASYKEVVDLRSYSKSAKELANELKDLITFMGKNLHHDQELQKRHHDKATKLRNYTSGDKIWLNSK